MPQAFPGPIKVSPDGRYFTDSRGLPSFWLGDTASPPFAQYTPENAKRYLLSHAELGYTVIQGVLAWGGGTGFETHSPEPNALGEVPWLEGNPARPNEAYFQIVDALVEFAAQHGLVLGMLALAADEMDTAVGHYLEAIPMAPDLLALAVECSQAFIEANRPQKWIDLLPSFSGSMRAQGVCACSKPGRGSRWGKLTRLGKSSKPCRSSKIFVRASYPFGNCGWNTICSA